MVCGKSAERRAHEVLKLALELLGSRYLEVLTSGFKDGDTQRWLEASELRRYGGEKLSGRVQVLNAAREEERCSEAAALLESPRELGRNGGLPRAGMTDENTDRDRPSTLLCVLKLRVLPFLEAVKDQLTCPWLDAGLRGVRRGEEVSILGSWNAVQNVFFLYRECSVEVDRSRLMSYRSVSAPPISSAVQQ